mmetsp:Transcript_1389/g.3837  ORF Transcript_1389/g.3837 Transcript_1389/m.3837 type:complete len:496 (-) Transcript_1389:1061-2548(-)
MTNRSRSSRTRRLLLTVVLHMISHCQGVGAAFAVAGEAVRPVWSCCRTRSGRSAGTRLQQSRDAADPLDVQSLLSLPRPSRLDALSRRVESFPRDSRAHLLLGFEWLRGHEDGPDGDGEDGGEGEGPSSTQSSVAPSRVRPDPLDAAIRHLGLAANLLPDHAAAHFQLASALEERARVRSARGEEKEDPSSASGPLDESIAEDRRRAVLAFGEAVRLEGRSLDAAGGVGVAGANVAGRYLEVLRRLRQASLNVGDEKGVLWTIDQECLLSSSKMPFAVEDERNGEDGMQQVDNYNLSEYEWIMGVPSSIDAPYNDGSRHVALRTIGDNAILGRNIVSAIRKAANEHWAKNRGESSSRFTMQFQGNSEVHLADLVANSPPWLKEYIDDALQRKVYPLIRKAFAEDGMEMPEGTLCVYDSLVVQYDGDAARQHGVIGAMQPLVGSIKALVCTIWTLHKCFFTSTRSGQKMQIRCTQKVGPRRFVSPNFFRSHPVHRN